MDNNKKNLSLTCRMASTGDELSLLGFGCMRFPKKGGRIDIEAVEQLVTHAIASGVNYFDTAWMYGGSKDALGTVLAKTDANGKKLREKVKIATKLAFISIKTREPYIFCRLGKDEETRNLRIKRS